MVAKAEALIRPMIPIGKRVQTLNPPSSEVGPSGTVATWDRVVNDEVDAMGFRRQWNGDRSSKYIPFDWSQP